MIPSYDDLTPGIPDISETHREDQLALFLARASTPNSATPNSATPGVQQTATLPTPSAHGLFACLRSSDGSPDRPVRASRDACLAIARDFSPRVRAASDHEALLDVSGLGALIGEPPVIVRELRRALDAAAVKAQVAIAPTQTMARLLATQCSDYPISRFPDLPVGLLRPLEMLPPAISHRDRARPYETLARWGIATLGDLAALPAAALSSRLGRRGLALQRLARGLDPAPFVPDGETPRYVGRLELEWPIETLEPLSFVFARLLDPLALALERADRGAVAVRLDLRLTDRSVHARVLPLPAPIRDPRVLRTLLLLDLESRPPFGGASEGRREPPRRGGPSAQRGGGGAPPSEVMIDVMIDVVTIELDPAPARIVQFSLLQRALPSPETLSTLTARLSALVGDTRIGSPVLLDTHQPGAFEMRRYAPENGAEGAEGARGASGASGANGAGARSAAGADGAGGAGGADGAGGAALVLRRQRHPPAVRVRVERGRPVHIASSKRGLPCGAIVQAAGPWRTSGAWWSSSWYRDEWDVTLSTGIVCRIFQDRTTERWFLEAIYD